MDDPPSATGREEARSTIRRVQPATTEHLELIYLRTGPGAAAPGISPALELILVDSADKTIAYRGNSQPIRTGFVGVRTPFTTGKLARRRQDETQVRIASLGSGLVRDALREARVRERDLPSALYYGDDPPLRQVVEALFTAVETGSHRSEIEMHADACALAIVSALTKAQPTFRFEERCAAERVREILHARMTEDFSLEDLAQEVELTRSYVVHAFKRAFGLAPFEYLMHLRVARARALLAAGIRPVDAAHAVGFYDQSHLNRWFHKAIGLTPGQYAADVYSNR